MSCEKCRITWIAHHLSNLLWVDVVQAKLIFLAFFFPVFVDIATRLVPSVMISLLAIVIKFFLLFVIIIYQYVSVCSYTP